MSTQTTNAMTVDSCLGPQSKNAPSDLLRIDGKLAFICATGGDRGREITVRMAACWNALNGIPLNEIESAAQSGSISHALQKVITRRDELMKALQLISDTDPVDAALDPQRAVRVARAAIAKATGSSNV
jgi:hypothetical protein